MDPVVAVVVVEQAVQRVRREHQDEVLGGLDVLEQVRVELARVQLVHVNEHLMVDKPRAPSVIEVIFE